MWFGAIVLKILYTEFSLIPPTCFHGGSDSEESACSAGEPGSIPGSGRSPGEGNGNLPQYSCLENLTDGQAWKARDHGIAKSWTCLSDSHTHTPMGKNLIKLFHSTIHPWWCSFSCAQSSVLQDSLQLEPAGLLCPWNLPGKNTGMGCHFLLQGIFSNPGTGSSHLLCLLHWQADSLPLAPPSKPRVNKLHMTSVQFSQSLSPVRLSATTWTPALQAILSITNSRSLPKLMSIESVISSNHLILCRPLLLQPQIPPSIRVFSNESTLCIRWPKYWSFRENWTTERLNWTLDWKSLGQQGDQISQF